MIIFRPIQPVPFACAQMGFTDTLMPWDVPFYAQHQEDATFAITDEELRPYFALPNVLNGLFSV